MFKMVLDFSEVFGSCYSNMKEITDLSDLYINYIPEETNYKHFVNINKLSKKLKKKVDIVDKYLDEKTREYLRNDITDTIKCNIIYANFSDFKLENINRYLDSSICLYSDGELLLDYSSEKVFKTIKGNKLKEVDIKIENVDQEDVNKVVIFYNQKFIKNSLMGFSQDKDFRKISHEDLKTALMDQLCFESFFINIDEVLMEYDEIYGFSSEEYQQFLKKVIDNIETDIEVWIKNEYNNKAKYC